MQTLSMSTRTNATGAFWARWKMPVLLAMVIIVAGCTMSETEQRTFSGAGIGAAAGAAGGAIIGAIVGVPAQGAAIGAAAGAAVGGAGGYIVDQQDKRQAAQSNAASLQQQNQQLRQENQQLRQQQQN